MRRKAVLLLTLIVAAASVIAACGIIGGGDGAKSGQSQNSEPFDLKLRHIQLGDANKNRLARLEAVLKKTQEQHPGLTIRLDGVDSEVNRKDKLRSEMAAGNPPDIFDTFGSPDVGLYAKEGLVLDIAPILQELGLRTSSSTWNRGRMTGRFMACRTADPLKAIFIINSILRKRGWNCRRRWLIWKRLRTRSKPTVKSRSPDLPRMPGFRS